MARKKEDNSPVPTPDRQLTVPSGFCITGHHQDCSYQFNSGKCGCVCHVPAVVPKKRGRPPGSKNKPRG